MGKIRRVVIRGGILSGNLSGTVGDFIVLEKNGVIRMVKNVAPKRETS